jgi:SAM-dependent methyltransferase
VKLIIHVELYTGLGDMTQIAVRTADGSQARLGQTVRVVKATPAKDSAAARSYDELVAAASSAPTEGWDFSFLAGRIGGSPLPWNYVELAQAAVTEARAVLDLDTGGGETLEEVLGGTPNSIASSRTVVATEPYPPNLPVAAERLGPLGVDVRARIDILPVEDDFADLVLNRHGALDAAEVARVLRPGGRLLTQQIGPENDAELNAALSAPPPSSGTSVAALVEKLQSVGLVVDEAQTATSEVRFGDIGAVVYQLRMVAWQIPDFDVGTYGDRMRALDARIRRDGPLPVRSRRVLVCAHRP